MVHGRRMGEMDRGAVIPTGVIRGIDQTGQSSAWACRTFMDLRTSTVTRVPTDIPARMGIRLMVIPTPL